MKLSKIVYLIALSIAVHKANAQTDSLEKQKLLFKISINYNSSLNYYGRTDSLKSTAFFPLAEFWFTKDFYVNAAPIFVSNSINSFEYSGSVATLGYLHITDKLITNLYLTKPFYKQSSQLVQSSLELQTGLNLSYLNKYINITAGGDLKMSEDLDYGATIGIDHIIRKELGENKLLIANPSIYAFAGTQNFTNTYYRKKTDFLIFPGNTEEIKKRVKKFDIMAYELSLPLILAQGKWMAILTPSYVLPQNLITIKNQPELSERGQNMFYATIALKHTF